MGAEIDAEVGEAFNVQTKRSFSAKKPKSQ
jgi:hypothetical protein